MRRKTVARRIKTYKQRIRHVVEKCTAEGCNGTRRYDEGPIVLRESDMLACGLEPAGLLDFAAPKTALRCWVGGGAVHIAEVCREGVELADMHGKPIAFRFNETTVVIRPGQDAEKVWARWWKKKYGKTPRQSARER
jgi:hypothetical protein